MPQSCPNLNESRHYADLLSLPFTDLRRLLTAARVSAAEVPMAAGLHYNYAAMPVEERHLDLLQGLSDEFDLVGQYQRLLAGERMNVGENRRVLHHLTRGQLGPAVMHDGR
ncbi:MAG: glucose-6-phosphate isomerase, partial [Desulfuromonas sp.]